MKYDDKKFSLKYSRCVFKRFSWRVKADNTKEA